MPRFAFLTSFFLVACGGASDEDEGPPPVDVPLQSTTFMVDVGTVDIIQPKNLRAIMDAYLGDEPYPTMLFHVGQETQKQITFDVAVGDQQGNQDLCSDVVRLPPADWTANPNFVIEEGTFPMTVWDWSFTLKDAFMSVDVSTDGKSWTDGEVEALLDAREITPLLPEGYQDLEECALLDFVGANCIDCPDGVQACGVTRIAALVAEVSTQPFEESPDLSGCY